MTLHRFQTDEGNGRIGELWLDPQEIVQYSPGRYGRPGYAQLRDGRSVEIYSSGEEIVALQRDAAGGGE